MKVSVTAEDIANGKRGDSKWCPVGLALQRIGRVLSTLDFCRQPCKEVIFRFMADFDDNQHVEPFEFEIFI